MCIYPIIIYINKIEKDGEEHGVIFAKARQYTLKPAAVGHVLINNAETFPSRADVCI